MWFQKNKGKVILPLLILAVLAAAFFWNGSIPGSRGGADSRAVNTPAVTVPETGEPTASPEKAAEDAQKKPQTAASAPSQSPAAAVDPAAGAASAAAPVPEEAPPPAEPENTVITDTQYTCTLSISCATINDNLSLLDAEKTDLVPADGWILPAATVTFYEGESVFNVLQRVCQQNGIQMEFENTPLYNSAYIQGINNLYEFDCGALSGWTYKVNDWFPNYGCSRYLLKDGDTVCWVYTCDLGCDVGGGYAAGA